MYKMETLVFTDDETGEEIVFAILSAVQYKEEGYILVVEEDDLENDEVTAYVMKATYIEEEDLIYEIVDEDAILEVVYPMLEDAMDTFEN